MQQLLKHLTKAFCKRLQWLSRIASAHHAMTINKRKVRMAWYASLPMRRRSYAIEGFLACEQKRDHVDVTQPQHAMIL